MTFISFDQLGILQGNLFDKGANGVTTSMTCVRLDFSRPLQVTGEEQAYMIVKRNIPGTLMPEEGAMRALAQGLQNVEDFLFITNPFYVNGNPGMQTDDRLTDGSVTLFPNGTFQASGPVYRVQYVKIYMNRLWQARLKISQDSRSSA